MDDKFFVNGSADMFEKEYILWFDKFYKTSIQKMKPSEVTEMRKKLMPAFICGLHTGLEGSIKFELLHPMLHELRKKCQ